MQAASKVAGNAFDFPVAIAGRIEPLSAADLARGCRLLLGLSFSPLFRLLQGPLGGRRENPAAIGWNGMRLLVFSQRGSLGLRAPLLNMHKALPII